MAAIENRHIIFLCHLIDSGKKRQKILLGINVLFTVSREQDILTLLQAKTLVNIAGLNLGKVLMQHLCHRTTSNIGTFLGQTTVSEITTRMLRVCHIDIADNVHNATVGLFRQTLILTPVTSFHVEDGDMQALSSNHTQARVGIPQHQYCIRLRLNHHLVALVDDVTHRGTKVITYCLHINVRVCQLQVLKEHPVQVIVVVLTSMSQQTVEVLTALGNHSSQSDYLWASTHDNQQLQFSIVLKMLYIHNIFL